MDRLKSLCCVVKSRGDEIMGSNPGSHLGAFRNSCATLYMKFITTLSEGTIVRNPAQTYKAIYSDVYEIAYSHWVRMKTMAQALST